MENHYFGLGERTIKEFPLQQDFHSQAGQNGGLEGYLAKIDAMGEEYTKTGTFNYSFPDKGHLSLLEAFADAVADDSPSPIDEMAGMHSTYLSLRAMDSIRQGISSPVNI